MSPSQVEVAWLRAGILPISAQQELELIRKLEPVTAMAPNSGGSPCRDGEAHLSDRSATGGRELDEPTASLSMILNAPERTLAAEGRITDQGNGTGG